MLGSIRGTLVEKRPPWLLVDAGGVGYEIEAPLSTFAELPAEGESVALHTHLVVREDAQLLFGFRTRGDRELFRALIRVNGVGPKVALALLSGLDAAELVRCVQAADTATLRRLPGIGKKNAERIVVEMRDRLDEGLGETIGAAVTAAVGGGDSRRAAGPAEEAEGALIALGYRPAEASRAVSAAWQADLSTEEVIRRALRAMVAPE